MQIYFDGSGIIWFEIVHEPSTAIIYYYREFNVPVFFFLGNLNLKNLFKRKIKYFSFQPETNATSVVYFDSFANLYC